MGIFSAVFVSLLFSAGFVQSQGNSCATTEICYDPKTSTMKAEWSGMNFQNYGTIGPKGEPGPRGLKGGRGDRGEPGILGPPGGGTVDEETIRGMVSRVLASFSSGPTSTTPVNISQSAEDRIRALERKVASLVADRSVGGKPILKPNVDPGNRSGEIDIYGWVNAANGYQYWVSGNVKYDEAIKLCKLKGGTLATGGIRNAEIRSFLVEKLIKKRGMNLWIGLDDIKEEGDWEWQDGVKSTGFNTDWDYGQPNDKRQRQDCAQIEYRSGRIGDYECDSDQNALCER